MHVVDELGDPGTGRRLTATSISREISAVAGVYRYAVRQRAVDVVPRSAPRL